jgi:hypothetical protein
LEEKKEEVKTQTPMPVVSQPFKRTVIDIRQQEKNKEEAKKVAEETTENKNDKQP